MSRIRLLRTASFRLAALYLALFTASALALGAFVYFSVRHEILTDFDERIAEESDALKSAFVDGGRDRLAAIIDARGSSGAGFAYGFVASDGKPIAGDLRLPRSGTAGNGWIEAQENDGEEPPEVQAGGHTFAHHAARRRVVPPRRRRAPPLGYDPDRRAGSLRLGGRGHARDGDDRRIVAERAVPGPYRTRCGKPPVASWTATGAGEFR